MLGRPRRNRATDTQSNHDHRITQARRHIDRRITGATQLGGGEARQLARVLSPLGMMGQARHEDVVA
jgi:hypothetical protein